MAREKSVTLTKAETKALTVDLKSQIKNLKTAAKVDADNFKNAEKAYNTAKKAFDKAAAASAKTLEAANKKLAALTAVPVVA